MTTRKNSLQAAAKAALTAGFAITGPRDVGSDDGRKVVLVDTTVLGYLPRARRGPRDVSADEEVLLVGSRQPRSECPSIVVRALGKQQPYVEFISYVYASPDDCIDIETTNASFNRRTDLEAHVERAIQPLHDAHVKKLLVAFKKAKLSSRVRSATPAIVPLPCDSAYFLAAFEEWKGGFVRCERHRGHDDNHRGTYRKAEPGLYFGDGSGLVWPNAGPVWTVKSLVVKKRRSSKKKVSVR